jgi:hypothetical protein
MVPVIGVVIAALVIGIVATVLVVGAAVAALAIGVVAVLVIGVVVVAPVKVVGKIELKGVKMILAPSILVFLATTAEEGDEACAADNSNPCQHHKIDNRCQQEKVTCEDEVTVTLQHPDSEQHHRNTR